MLIDLHCHTRVYSQCSAMTPEALVRAARAAGLDGVCITEHDAIWPLADVERLAAEMGFLVLRGMEVTTEVGHVLAYGLAERPPQASLLAGLRAYAETQGALLFLAHPGRRTGLLPPDGLAAFHSLEVANGTEGALQNGLAADQARGLRLPGIGGSDAHSVREVGACATKFERSIKTEAEFLAELRAGRYQAVDRRTQAPGRQHR